MILDQIARRAQFLVRNRVNRRPEEESWSQTAIKMIKTHPRWTVTAIWSL